MILRCWRSQKGVGDFRANGSWPPSGPRVGVEQAAIGEAFEEARLEAHASIERHASRKRLFYNSIRSAIEEDFHNDDRFLYHLQHSPSPPPTPEADLDIRFLRTKEWTSAFLRPVSLKDPVWEETVVLYTPKEARVQVKAAQEFKWDVDSFGRYAWRAILRFIDPALPKIVARHEYWEEKLEESKEQPVPHLIAYERVKVKNLRTLWPVRELQFRPLDNLKIDLATVFALGAVLARVKLDSLFTQVSAFALCTAWVLGAIFRVTAQRNEYELEVSPSSISLSISCSPSFFYLYLSTTVAVGTLVIFRFAGSKQGRSLYMVFLKRDFPGDQERKEGRKL
jgi:hypothetical protein